MIFRKVTNCFRIQPGASLYADIRSVIETARRRAIGVLDAIRSTLDGSPLAESHERSDCRPYPSGPAITTGSRCKLSFGRVDTRLHWTVGRVKFPSLCCAYAELQSRMAVHFTGRDRRRRARGLPQSNQETGCPRRQSAAHSGTLQNPTSQTPPVGRHIRVRALAGPIVICATT